MTHEWKQSWLLGLKQLSTKSASAVQRTLAVVFLRFDGAVVLSSAALKLAWQEFVAASLAELLQLASWVVRKSSQRGHSYHPLMVASKAYSHRYLL